MAHIDRTPLGAATLVRKWYLDWNSGTYGAPSWVAVNGVVEFTPKITPVLQDDSDYDSAGYGSQAKTALNWTADLKVGRKVRTTDPTLYDAGQEGIRAAAKAFGSAGIVDVRFYEVTASGPIAEAYRGYAEVTYEHGGGGMTALDTASIILTGRGELDTITHPDYAAAKPILYSITPATDVEAGGAPVIIKGTNFFASGVDDVVSIAFGATNCPDYITVDDQTIFAIVPAHAAATVAVAVTNAQGASTVTVNFVYTVA